MHIKLSNYDSSFPSHFLALPLWCAFGRSSHLSVSSDSPSTWCPCHLQRECPNLNHFFPHLLALCIVSLFSFLYCSHPQVTKAGKLRTLLPSYPIRAISIEISRHFDNMIHVIFVKISSFVI